MFTSSSQENLQRQLCPNDTTAGPQLGSKEQQQDERMIFRIPVALWPGRLSESQ